MTGKRGLSLDALERIFKALRLRVTPEEGSHPAGGEEPPPAGPKRRKGKGG
jgi:hypothetical protein